MNNVQLKIYKIGMKMIIGQWDHVLNYKKNNNQYVFKCLKYLMHLNVQDA